MSLPMSRRRRAALALIAVSAPVLAGCSLPDVSMSPGLDTQEASATSSSPSRTPRPSASPVAVVPERVPGELDAGSTTHLLAAGDRTVVIDYWTDEAAADWTAADTKAIQVSARLEDDATEQTVLVTRFFATVDDGTARTVVTEDRGEFALMPPFTYGTVLSIQPSAAEIDLLTVYVQLEMLVETEPESGRYYRQTVQDSLVLPLLEENRK